MTDYERAQVFFGVHKFCAGREGNEALAAELAEVRAEARREALEEAYREVEGCNCDGECDGPGNRILSLAAAPLDAQPPPKKEQP